MAAAGGVVLAGETIRAAAAGEKTPIEFADDYYQTHFGDIWGWIKGDYSHAAATKAQQLEKATADANERLSNAPAGSPELPCQAAASQQASPASPEDLRDFEYKSYKARCGQSPPSGLSPCDEARWKLQRNKDCRDLRQAWDDKWQPGRHKNDIENLDRSINNLEEWIKKNCP